MSENLLILILFLCNSLASAAEGIPGEPVLPYSPRSSHGAAGYGLFVELSPAQCLAMKSTEIVREAPYTIFEVFGSDRSVIIVSNDGNAYLLIHSLLSGISEYEISVQKGRLSISGPAEIANVGIVDREIRVDFSETRILYAAAERYQDAGGVWRYNLTKKKRRQEPPAESR